LHGFGYGEAELFVYGVLGVVDSEVDRDAELGVVGDTNLVRVLIERF
jgi:hypothetical protein